MAKRKRKVDAKRLAIVAAAGLLCILLAGTALIGSIRWVAAQFSGPSKIVLEDGSELEPVELAVLQRKIQNEFKISRLADLKTDISTYLYNNQLAPLKEQIDSYLKSQNVDLDKIAWAVQDLTTDAYIESDNAAKNFVAASTYKLPLMMLWYDKIANGSATYETQLQFTAGMKEQEDYENPTQPIVRKYRTGDMIPLENLLEAGALYSDNIAGHMLFEYLGGYYTYKTMAMEYSDAPQDKDFTNPSMNVLNPDYTMDLVYKLYHDKGTYDDLKYWLINAGPNMFLNGNGYKGYIQKVGNIEEVRNVVGYLPGEFPYSVSIYSSIGKDEGEQVIADIGDICYSYFAKRYQNGDYDAYPLEERISIGQVTSVPRDPLAAIPDLPEDEINASIIRKPGANSSS